MHADPRECMFCTDQLPVRTDEPANLAFLAHIEQRPDCRTDFDAWVHNMQQDWIGD